MVTVHVSQTASACVGEVKLYYTPPRLAVFIYGVQELQGGVSAICLTVCHHGSGQ